MTRPSSNRRATPVWHSEAAGGAHIPANDDRKSATVTATDRKQANQLDRGG